MFAIDLFATDSNQRPAWHYVRGYTVGYLTNGDCITLEIGE